MNMIKTLLLIAICIILFSCDNRNANIPELAVTISKDSTIINTLYTNTESNSANIHIKLSGEYEDAYANKRVDMEYDHSKLTVVVGGDANFCYTDGTGTAQGFITALSSGDTNIRFYLRDYKNVSVKKNLTILDPSISYLAANPTSAIADGNPASVITIRITPSTSGKQIALETTLGTLNPETATTNANGEATTVISSTEAGRATVTATIPTDSRSINNIYFTSRGE